MNDDDECTCVECRYSRGDIVWTHITVSGGVATAWAGDERIGEWEAGPDAYRAAGVEWPGCDCGAQWACQHDYAVYWGVVPPYRSAPAKGEEDVHAAHSG